MATLSRTGPRAYRTEALARPRTGLLVLVLVLSAGFLSLQPMGAEAKIDGDCGPSWAPDGGFATEFCRKFYDWGPGTKTLKIKVVDADLVGTLLFGYNGSYVVPAWNNAAGPQSLKWSDRPGDTEVILYAVTNTGVDNVAPIPGLPAQTVFCGAAQGICDLSAKNVHHSKHFFAINNAAQTARLNDGTWSAVQKQWVLAHESGHGLGLDHSANSLSIMYPTKRSFYAAGNLESGPASPCNDGSVSATWGTRCVFHYTGNNAGGDEP
jgi:hypothetical protein